MTRSRINGLDQVDLWVYQIVFIDVERLSLTVVSLLHRWGGVLGPELTEKESEARRL